MSPWRKIFSQYLKWKPQTSSLKEPLKLRNNIIYLLQYLVKKAECDISDPISLKALSRQSVIGQILILNLSCFYQSLLCSPPFDVCTSPARCVVEIEK